jgi:hypothetical protein
VTWLQAGTAGGLSAIPDSDKRELSALQCSVNVVHGLELLVALSATSCSKPWTPGHLKTEHTESLFLLRRHLGNWPAAPQYAREANC